VRIGRKLTFGDITKKVTRTRGILYPILNRKSPVPIQTKLNMPKLHIAPILTYAGSFSAPIVDPSQWKRIEGIQNISTITGLPTIVKNSILLKSTKCNARLYLNSIQSTALRKFLFQPWSYPSPW